ncbi:hypothetical protein OE88DRAFT_1660259 [Heliocybe sulcata]|uniref:Uncharacterized protein n=1 Tax=Heliocybe sulcata TaxID=5364 RepID=A0A5C3N1W2_9AGAM|nr:hypothetical protein OE88DRAFT_1660259 [Heliocybe sulcata]
MTTAPYQIARCNQAGQRPTKPYRVRRLAGASYNLPPPVSPLILVNAHSPGNGAPDLC